MVVASQHAGDAHLRVVHRDGEVVGRRSFGADDDEVADLLTGHGKVPVHEVFPLDRGAVLDAETQRGGLAGFHAAARLLRRDGAALTRVARRAALLKGAFALGLEVVWRTEAVIGEALFEQPRGELPVGVLPLALAVGLERSARARALVPVYAEPFEVSQQRFLALARGALDVSVLDAEYEFAAFLAGQQPVVERGAHVADVQMPSRAGREAIAVAHCRSV